MINKDISCMEILTEIRNKMLLRQYEFSKHAVDQSIIRDISVSEVEESILTQRELTEDYPNDKYGASFLILGFTKTGQTLHIQCSYPSRPLIKIITVYEPNAALWIDFRIREKNRKDLKL